MRFLAITCILITCIHPSELIAQQAIRISELRLIDEFQLRDNFQFENTRVGGLSGIDYDTTRQLFYLISDDRSAINPARFYTAKIHLSPQGKIDSLSFLSVHTLLQENGKPFPSNKVEPGLAPDPESIRYNSITNQIVWTSEGDKSSLTSPSLDLANIEGAYQGTYSLPENLDMKSGEQGPRQNGTLEGLAFNSDFTLLYASMEEALYEDGPRTQIEETKSWVRITAFETSSKKAVAQYAYRLESLTHKPFPPGSFGINGVTEILCIGKDQLLFVERSYSTGRLACTVKVFLGDLSQAENVLQVPSLTENPPAHPIEKKLLLNMDDSGIFIDNIEGVTFGPDLPNGHKTLIFVADNNFQSIQKNQFLLFEIIP
ncbi:MAG: esterase-like activity of phytase family protein [Cyclobacteriaceae bacterium]|nr:esterase-like activity of phytase family protein [Cyclobacteriaceae bacterium]